MKTIGFKCTFLLYFLHLSIHCPLRWNYRIEPTKFLPISHEILSHGQLTRALLPTNQIPCVLVLRQSDHERPNRERCSLRKVSHLLIHLRDSRLDKFTLHAQEDLLSQHTS